MGHQHRWFANANANIVISRMSVESKVYISRQYSGTLFLRYFPLKLYFRACGALDFSYVYKALPLHVLLISRI